ncbi:MAG: glycosyltransferase [Acidimicrobiales bacterium]
MKLRVLLATAYSPTASHDHAAADLAHPLVTHLSHHVELFVYAPDQSSLSDREAPGLEFLEGTARGRGLTRHISARPSWLRREWSPAATAEVLEYLDRLRPDVLHCEYLQASEPILVRRYPSVVGLHDCSTDVQRRLLATTDGPRKCYRWAELMRTKHLEQRVLAAASVVVALSWRDASLFQRYTDRVVVSQPGIALPRCPWTGAPSQRPPTLLFFGAMWRSANIAIAQFLVKEVLPYVWVRRPDITLRIAGSRPAAEVQQLAALDSRVEVSGFIDDLDALVARSSLVLAPNLLGGGIQLKILRSLAVGCPVVTSRDAAEAVGAEDERHLLVGADSVHLAAQVLRLLDDQALAARLGAAGRQLVSQRFDWSQTVATYVQAYQRAVGES